MNEQLKKILKPLASLRITVGLLLASMLLVYVGTLAQRSADNFQVQREYFHSWLVYMPFKHLIPFGNWQPAYGFMFLGGYSLIVGILVNLIAAHTIRFKFKLGDLALVPVLVLTGYFVYLAQTTPNALYISLTVFGSVLALGLCYWLHDKRTGVIVIHFGLILILVGELVTSLAKHETTMTLEEGDRRDWVIDARYVELAIIDPTPADHDVVTAVPGSKFARDGAIVQDLPNIPFQIRIDAYYPNAEFTQLDRAPTPPVKATTGEGLEVAIVPQRVFTGVGGEAENVNAPAAYATILKDGKQLDTLMLSAYLQHSQRIEVDGKPYNIDLRFVRYYKPYTIQLIDFTHETHLGTSKAKNFAAHLRLLDPKNSVDREVTVRMNQPLRYAGDTIYQSGFNPRNPKVSTLQVVRNPVWLMPYIACAVGGLGMLLHFLQSLVPFVIKQFGKHGALAVAAAAAVGGVAGVVVVGTLAGRREQRRRQREIIERKSVREGIPIVEPLSAYTLQPKRRLMGRLVPIGLVLLCLFYAGMHAAPRAVVTEDRTSFNLAEWGKLPVNFEGREMPLDSVARNTLKVISGKQTFAIETKDANGKVVKETKVQAIQWLIDTMSGRTVASGTVEKAPEKEDAKKLAATYKVFRIDEPGVKAFLNLPPEEKLFTVDQVLPDKEAIHLHPPESWRPTAPNEQQYAVFVAFGQNATRPAVISVSHMEDQSDNLLGNINRWRNQVGLEKASRNEAMESMSPATAGDRKGWRIDVTGPGNEKTGPLRTVAVMVSRFKESWVFKITGAPEQVEAELPAFDKLLKDVTYNRVFDEFARASEKQSTNKDSLDLYDRKILQLSAHLTALNRVMAIARLYGCPPLEPGQTWRTLGEARAEADNAAESAKPNPSLQAFVDTLRAWRENKPADFNAAVTNYQTVLQQRVPAMASKSGFETFYNRFSPFWVSWGLYIFAAVLGCLSWIMFGPTLVRGALAVLCVSFLIHTFGIIARIYISGRPPVTNLYSSAVFISWVVVLVCIVLEWIFKNGLSVVAAALVGFLALLVSDGIEFADAVARNEGDTMAQLQAVLDTNFWLATHVVMITMGYAATFLAGALAILYVLGGCASHGALPDGTLTGTSKIYAGPLGDVFNDPARKLFVRMVYGVICFAMLLSFVGTILGGIWADQSWGRFWGWDSKENGAILLVLWNAIILHARWAGMIRDRGLMSLSIIGIIVTAWSWFGTNELGIGLHSYGFTEGVVPALLTSWGVCAALAVIAITPLSEWRSIPARVLTADD